MRCVRSTWLRRLFLVLARRLDIFDAGNMLARFSTEKHAIIVRIDGVPPYVPLILRRRSYWDSHYSFNEELSI